MDPDEVFVDNGKRLMSLNELARTQPGMDRLMFEISERARRLYYAATLGNWPAAGYFCRTLGKHLRESAFVRPKYAEAMEEFLETEYARLRDAVAAQDGAAFADAWDALVVRINHWHDYFGKDYLVYRTPDTPPPDLDLAPRGTEPRD